MDIEESRARLEKHMLAQADSVGELLEQFRGRISPALIGGPGWDRLLERTRTLPISLATSGFGFELPLHEPELRADFGVALFEGSLSAAHFEEWCRAHPDDPSTAAASRLLGAMGRESAIQRIGGTKLMLEYDIDPGRAGRLPDPGVFLYTAPDALSREDSVRGLEGFLAAADAVAAAGAWKLEAGERRQIERLFSVMPPGTGIGSVGAFPARSEGLRIAVTGLEKTRDPHGVPGALRLARAAGGGRAVRVGDGGTRRIRPPGGTLRYRTTGGGGTFAGREFLRPGHAVGEGNRPLDGTH